MNTKTWFECANCGRFWYYSENNSPKRCPECGGDFYNVEELNPSISLKGIIKKYHRGNKIHYLSTYKNGIKTACGLLPYIIAWQGPGVIAIKDIEKVTCKHCLQWAKSKKRLVKPKQKEGFDPYGLLPIEYSTGKLGCCLELNR